MREGGSHQDGFEGLRQADALSRLKPSTRRNRGRTPGHGYFTRRDSMPEEPFELQPYEGEPGPKNKVRGYAAHPGTGPAGESCRTCKHLGGHSRGRRWYKCSLVKMTLGPGTDIRLKSPACWRWEPGEERADGRAAAEGLPVDR